jgi:hypothetical protein
LHRRCGRSCVFAPLHADDAPLGLIVCGAAGAYLQWPPASPICSRLDSRLEE